MLLTRKIGAALRGKATPRQVLFATVIGGLLGFVPGFFLPGDLGGGLAQAPGLILLLLSLALVLNANLGVFALTLVVGKLLSLLLLPVSYAVGTWLLDGPLQGLFRALANGPVTAWFGLEYYATTGGLVLGAVFGVGSGVVLNRTIRAIRTRMADVEEHSERYQKYARKWWVRLCSWLLLGKGKGKQSWRELSESTKKGLPVRVTGVIVVGVLGAALWVFQQWFSTPILTQNLKSGLEAANGATVDVTAARLGLADGNLRVEGLAIADAKALDANLFAADALVATIDTGALLRRRFVIDEVRSTNARSGERRATPGVRLPGAAPAPEPPPPPAGTRTIDDYMKDIELWRGRLEQVRDWIEQYGGGGEPKPAPTPEEIEAERKQQEEAGLARVVARHLLADAPRFLIRKVDLEGIGISIGGAAEKLDLRLRNISDAPSLVADVLSVSCATQSDKLAFQLTGPAAGADRLGLDFAYKRLPVDALFGQLKIQGKPPLSGGTIDLAAKGALVGLGKALSLDLPLSAELRDTTFAFAGMQPTAVDKLVLPVGLSGPLTRPAVALDDKTLQQALLDAGQKELANFVQGQAGKLLGGLPADLQGVVDPTKSVGENLDAAKQKLEEEKKRLEEEAKKKAADEAKKLLPGGLKGLLPGGKKTGGE